MQRVLFQGKKIHPQWSCSVPALSWQHYTVSFEPCNDFIVKKKRFGALSLGSDLILHLSDFKLALFPPQHELFNNHCIVQYMSNAAVYAKWPRGPRSWPQRRPSWFPALQEVCSRTHIILQECKVQIKSGAFFLHSLMYQIMC